MRYTEKRRQFTREINFVKQAMFFATAAAFAAGASDMAGNAVAGGLGNFGDSADPGARVLYGARRHCVGAGAGQSVGSRRRGGTHAAYSLGSYSGTRGLGASFCERRVAASLGRGLTSVSFSETIRFFPAVMGMLCSTCPGAKRTRKCCFFVSIGGVRSEET